MKYLKFYKKFFEDGDSGGTATANASNTSGMGAVVAAQPGALPGTFGTDGSGDIGFTFKKEKRKKGKPSEVSDLRDLEPAKDVTKVEESISNKKEKDLIFDCLLDLLDEEFGITDIEEYPRSILTKDELITSREIIISLHKNVYKKWRGNIEIRYEFNKEGIISSRSLSNNEPGDGEIQLINLIDDCSHRLINLLNFKTGEFKFSCLVVGSAMPWNTERNVNINIGISLLSESNSVLYKK
jgi:hypothetical protein